MSRLVCTALVCKDAWALRIVVNNEFAADLTQTELDEVRPRFGYSTVMLNVVSMVKLNSSNVPPTWIVWLPGLSGVSIR